MKNFDPSFSFPSPAHESPLPFAIKFPFRLSLHWIEPSVVVSVIRNKQLPRAGQTLDTFHGNNRLPPYLPTRRSSLVLISFDPHSRRNCCRTRCKHNAHQNNGFSHVLPKKPTTIGEGITRDNCLQQFLPGLRYILITVGQRPHSGHPRFSFIIMCASSF